MIQAKKSLGQNFLYYPKATNRIADVVCEKNISTVIEIGPGKCALTKHILEKTNATIYAVELDDRMCVILREKFANAIEAGRLHIIHQDILDANLHDVTDGKLYGVVGNLPFYITGAIMRKFLTDPHQPNYMTLITQKEVADRIVCRDNKESVLSLSVKAYGTPKYEMKIPKKYFTPSPNVDAALITISNINRDNFSNVSEDDFFTIVKAGFKHKRKKLSSNIKDHFNQPIEEVFSKTNIDPNTRAEEVPLATWLDIVDMV